MDSGKYMIDDDMVDELSDVADDISDDYRARIIAEEQAKSEQAQACLLYTSPSPRDMRRSRMPSSA